ncbi:M50 family metallopeptidase [Alkalihalobacillus sp. FSL R5-0424]
MIKVWNLLSIVRINPFFWIVLAIGLLTGYFREAILLFFIVFIHELGHATAALHFKWKLRKIELLPFGGVAEVEESGNKPIKEELIVILSGPIQHLWMIGLSFLLVQTNSWSSYWHELFVWHNLVILCFNLLPILPLDGGKLVQLWFMERWSYKKAHLASIISSVSVLIIVALCTLILPFHLNMILVLLFLVINNYLEWKQRHYRFMRFLTERNHLPNKEDKPLVLFVPSDIPVREAVRLLRRGYRHEFRFENDKQQVSESTVLQALFDRKLTEPLHAIPTIPPRINSIQVKVQ